MNCTRYVAAVFVCFFFQIEIGMALFWHFVHSQGWDSAPAASLLDGRGEFAGSGNTQVVVIFI